MQRAEQQKQFFEAFGYLVLPGHLKADIGWIATEFAAVFTDRGIQHDATQRTTVVPFIDQRERLCTLLDHPLLVPILDNLLGANWNYIGGDGNFYTGDTNWHSDGFHHVGQFLKVALYLDAVQRETGCLRVIPGSHLVESRAHWQAHFPARAHDLWDIEPKDVPCVALESQPGDVVIFNHNLLHSAFGGNSKRRMFTLNVCRHCETDAEIEDLKLYISGHDRFWIDSLHGDLMRSTASPERSQHLQQVTQHETHLPALSALARHEMAEAGRH